jgi:hypothetical protein
MKQLLKSMLMPAAVAAVLALSGCATNTEYPDDKEYSDLPWNTPQSWERSPAMPGLSPGY